MSDVKFKVVDRSHIPQSERHGRPPTELSLTLARGEAVFLPLARGDTTPNAVAALYQRRGYLVTRGFKPHVRRGIEDGVEGLFLWAERNGHA